MRGRKAYFLNHSPQIHPKNRFLNKKENHVSAEKWRKYVVFGGALQGTRTPDLLVRSQTLYPAELAAHCLSFDSFYIIYHLPVFVKTF